MTHRSIYTVENEKGEMSNNKSLFPEFAWVAQEES
jgi:hypothetical protein